LAEIPTASRSRFPRLVRLHTSMEVTGWF